MQEQKTMLKIFSPEDIDSFKPEMKTGLLAIINEQGLLNNTPLFRYNSYFGIHTVYYLYLVEQNGKETLPLGSLVQATVKTMISRTLAGVRDGKAALNLSTEKLMDKTGNLKFLAYIDKDGYPFIIPVIQAMTAGTDSVVFSSSVYNSDLQAVPSGATFKPSSLIQLLIRCKKQKSNLHRF